MHVNDMTHVKQFSKVYQASLSASTIAILVTGYTGYLADYRWVIHAVCDQTITNHLSNSKFSL